MYIFNIKKKKDTFLYLVLCTYLTLKKKDMFLYLVLCTYLTLKKKDMFLYPVLFTCIFQGAKHFDFIPPSFILPSEYQDFCCKYMLYKM